MTDSKGPMTAMANEDLATATPTSPAFPHTLDSVTALARFEFEPGRGNEGTKVLMVEWQDDDTTRSTEGKYNVSWKDKKVVFSASDDNTSADRVHRVYFLLPPGVVIPPHVTLAFRPPKSKETDEVSPELKMSVNPLPAIFTPELGATAKQSGKKGVLHTLWAKKRLQALEKEIKREQEHNLEGIALEMAQSEKTWIETTFGLQQPQNRPSRIDLSGVSGSNAFAPSSPGIQSPRSPGGRRLSEKLKGLSLQTSEKDLSGSRVNTITREANPLSPEASDMAYSSFSVFKGTSPQPAAQLHPEQPSVVSPKAQQPTELIASSTVLSAVASSTDSVAPSKKMFAPPPPQYIRQQQQAQTPAMSLDFLSQNHSTLPSISEMDNFTSSHNRPDSAQKPQHPFKQHSQRPPTPPSDESTEEDLFAVALSPTSPDMPKSPFSFSSEEVGAGAVATTAGNGEAFARIKGTRS